MLLTLTQKQTCERIATEAREAAVLAEKWLAGMTTILSEMAIETDFTEYSIDDFIDWGILNTNLGFREVAFFNDNYTDAVVGRTVEQISLFFNNISYIEEETCSTIMDYVHQKGCSTLVELTGVPIMQYFTSRGFPTIKNGAFSLFNYSVAAAVGDLSIHFADTTIAICRMVVNATTNKVALTKLIDSDLIDRVLSILQNLALCSQANGMLSKLAFTLSQGNCTPSNLLAVLNQYASSNWGSIRSFVDNIVQSSSDALAATMNSFIALFRNAQSYHETADGKVVWDTPGSSVNTSAFMIAAQIGTSVLQTLGYVLLFGGWTVGKLLGGLMLISGSILSTVTSTIGQISGTTPYINDEATDHVYADPIFQGNETISLKYLSQASETLTNLRDNGRSKIVAPHCVIYMYNADFDTYPNAVNVDYKIFAGADFDFMPYFWTDNHLVGGIQKGLLQVYFQRSSSTFMALFNQRPGSRQYSILISRELESIITRATRTAKPDIYASSADANKWVKLWDVVVSNALLTMCTVYCSPFFQSHGLPITNQNISVGGLNQSFGDIKYLLYSIYDLHDGTAGDHATDIINAIGAITGVDHSNDNSLFCALSTLGVTDVSTQQVVDDFYGTDVSRELETAWVYSTATVNSESVYVCACYTSPVSDSERANAAGMWLQSYYYALPFTTIDKYAYITPPEHSFVNVLWGAIIVAGVATAVVATVVIGRAVLAKKLRSIMYTKGSQLMADGETFRKGWTPAEWAELSVSDKAEYTRALNKYNFQVKIYNGLASLCGLSSIDWMNNWWNAPSSVGLIPATIATQQGCDLGQLLDSDSVKMATASGLSQLGWEVTDNSQYSTRSILQVITGNPNYNR